MTAPKARKGHGADTGNAGHFAARSGLEPKARPIVVKQNEDDSCRLGW